MTNRTFMTVEEVAAELGVSKSYAYKIVKQLNDELQKLGYLTVIVGLLLVKKISPDTGRKRGRIRPK